MEDPRPIGENGLVNGESGDINGDGGNMKGA